MAIKTIILEQNVKDELKKSNCTQKLFLKDIQELVDDYHRHIECFRGFHSYIGYNGNFVDSAGFCYRVEKEKLIITHIDIEEG